MKILERDSGIGIHALVRQRVLPNESHEVCFIHVGELNVARSFLLGLDVDMIVLWRLLMLIENMCEISRGDINCALAIVVAFDYFEGRWGLSQAVPIRVVALQTLLALL